MNKLFALAALAAVVFAPAVNGEEKVAMVSPSIALGVYRCHVAANNGDDACKATIKTVDESGQIKGTIEFNKGPLDCQQEVPLVGEIRQDGKIFLNAPAPGRCERSFEMEVNSRGFAGHFTKGPLGANLNVMFVPK
jgi:hypothetical protein